MHNANYLSTLYVGAESFPNVKFHTIYSLTNLGCDDKLVWSELHFLKNIQGVKSTVLAVCSKP